MTSNGERPWPLVTLLTEQVLRRLEVDERSQSWLARRLDVAPSWVTRRMSGETAWTLEDVDRLAVVLDVPAVDLLQPLEVSA